MTNTEVTESPVTDEAVMEHLQEHGTQRLADQLEQGVVTPIELAKALDIRPQMVYNYIRNDRIKAHKTLDTQKLVIDLADATAFVRTRLEKEQKKAAQVIAELNAGVQAAKA